MDLMTLAAKITLDDSSYTKGIKNAENMGQQLAGKMSAMTVAVGNIAADMIRKGVSAVNGIVKGAIDSYADYQQLIGGVETLFKGSADKVANYAKNAYKNAGLSANDYMETVTSFSASLLQGLGGDTEAAADIANTAIQDMADNANKMGTDISSIQAAYMGFAKQNYTMLDNLKLGYGGTASEMIRLINDSGILEDEIKDLDGITFDQLVAAIHKIQDEMGITGTTAKEAEGTITGSAASMKAAWQDMLSAIGGEGDQARLDESMENFKKSFGAYMENFIPTLVTTVTNSGSLVTAIAESISNLPTNLLSRVGTGFFSAGTEMVGGISKITGWLIDSLINMFQEINIDSSKVTEFGNAIGSFIGDTLSKVALNLPTIVEGMFNFGVSLAAGIIDGIWSGLFGDDSNGELEKIQKEAEDKINAVEISSTRAAAILEYMQGLVDKYGEAATKTEEWKTAENNLEEVLGGSSQVFEDYGEDVQGAINHLKDMSEELRKLAIQQAVQEKLEAQYKALGEYTVQQIEAEVAKGEAEQGIENIRQKRLESLKAYAGQFHDLIKEAGQQNNPLIEDLYKRSYFMSQGNYIDPYTGEQMRMEQMTQQQISEFFDAITDMLVDSLGDEEGVWDKDLFDNILSPEALEALDAENARYEQAIKDADAAIEEAQKKVDAANKAISDTEAAADKAAKQLNAAADAASNFAGSLSGGSGNGKGSGYFFGGNSGSTGSWFMPRAVGLDYVPYNGFKAELHRGEAIITAEENSRRMNSGTSAEEFAEIMEGALISAMNRVNVYMSGEKVGDLTTKRVKNNINGSSYARMRSMGG